MNRKSSTHPGTGRARKRTPQPHSPRHAAPSGRDRVSASHGEPVAELVRASSAPPTSCVGGEAAAPHERPSLAAHAIAASDDAESPVASGIASKDASCANGEACAAAALSRKELEAMATRKSQPASPTQSATRNDDPGTDSGNEALKVPTDLAALADGPAYVRAVAAQVDLVAASAKLVISTDEKIAKAELDRLRELIFGKGGPPPADDTLRIDWTGFPRPERDVPAFTQNSGGERADH